MQKQDVFTPDCPSNEELAVRIQAGDKDAAEALIRQNEGFLISRAKRLTQYCDFEDLKQEAAIAFLQAAESFDPSHGTKLLTYAVPIIDAALSDYAAGASLPLTLPSGRYQQLRQVARLSAMEEFSDTDKLLSAIQEKLCVSEKVAQNLLKEYRQLFSPVSLEESAVDFAYDGDPAHATTGRCVGNCYSNVWKKYSNHAN